MGSKPARGFGCPHGPERRQWGYNGRPQQWMALSGDWNISQGSPANQNSEANHWIKVSSVAIYIASIRHSALLVWSPRSPSWRAGTTWAPRRARGPGSQWCRRDRTKLLGLSFELVLGGLGVSETLGLEF